jgi:transcriptional regulator with XRE-family HTH domain
MELDHIGRRIRSCREQKGLSVEELAKGISTPRMVELTERERGNPSFRILERYAERLGYYYEAFVRRTRYDVGNRH